MRLLRALRRDQSGVAVIEMAFALPALIIMLWMIVQLGLVYRAMSGIQHSLGEGARLASIFPAPDHAAIEAKMAEAVYGVGPGEFEFEIITEPDDPDTVGVDESDTGYVDLQVTYEQETDLLLLPGPTIEVERSKRVWMSEAGT